MAGLALLAISFTQHAQGPSGTYYLKEALEMARRMKLFGVAERLGSEDFDRLSEDKQRATMHAAWGTFNLLT